MREFMTIFKKELKMFFSNRRLLIAALIPGLIMVVFYIFISNMAGTKSFKNESFPIGVINQVEDYQNKLLSDSYTFEFLTYATIEEAKTDLEQGNISLLIEFDENFKDKVTSDLVPNLNLYYDGANEKSNFVYNYAYSIFVQDYAVVNYHYTLNKNISPDLSLGRGESIRLMAMLIPYLLITILFGGCVNATSTVIAGEKERGTMATLLVTPVKRSTICFGKLAALSVIALFISCLSLAFNVLGTKLANKETLGFDLSLYSPIQIIEILVIIFTSVLFFTAALSCISTYSKSVKEANSLSGALNMLILLLAMTTITGFSPSNDAFYLIPFYNSVISLSSIFSMTYTVRQFLFTIGSILISCGLCVFLCKKMFDSERIMFSKK